MSSSFCRRLPMSFRACHAAVQTPTRPLWLSARPSDATDKRRSARWRTWQHRSQPSPATKTARARSPLWTPSTSGSLRPVGSRPVSPRRSSSPMPSVCRSLSLCAGCSASSPVSWTSAVQQATQAGGMARSTVRHMHVCTCACTPGGDDDLHPRSLAWQGCIPIPVTSSAARHYLCVHKRIGHESTYKRC
jgi:hypothetical protein